MSPCVRYFLSFLFLCTRCVCVCVCGARARTCLSLNQLHPTRLRKWLGVCLSQSVRYRRSSVFPCPLSLVQNPGGPTPNPTRTCGIPWQCVGETSRAKASFWPEVLEISEKNDSDEIWSTAEGIREATGWECHVDKNNVYALCQLHEVYVDEKQRLTDNAIGPSKPPKS